MFVIYFRSPHFVSFVLNKAIISIGLAACNVAKPETYFNGTSLYDNIINNSFEGTTGEVAYLDTGSRVPTSAIYSMNNFRATPPVNGTITFVPTRTSVFQQGAWVQEQMKSSSTMVVVRRHQFLRQSSQWK